MRHATTRMGCTPELGSCKQHEVCSAPHCFEQCCIVCKLTFACACSLCFLADVHRTLHLRHCGSTHISWLHHFPVPHWLGSCCLCHLPILDQYHVQSQRRGFCKCLGWRMGQCRLAELSIDIQVKSAALFDGCWLLHSAITPAVASVCATFQFC